MQAVPHCRRCGIAGGAALQAVQHCRRCGIAGGVALQAVWHCRRYGIIGGSALQAVRKRPMCQQDSISFVFTDISLVYKSDGSIWVQSNNVLDQIPYLVIFQAVLMLELVIIFMVQPQTILNLAFAGWSVSKQISKQALCLNAQAYNCLIHFSSWIMQK